MSKPPKRSAGLLMYRRTLGIVEVFLVHPGGPYWSNKNEGSWTIPKGGLRPAKNRLVQRFASFRKRPGSTFRSFIALELVQQKTGKIVVAWAFDGNCEPADLVSNTCEIEWPPRSGKKIVIPEVDRGDWFSFDRARRVIRNEQTPLLDALTQQLASFS